MTRPVVKVCGVAHEAEIEILAAAGADFCGLIVDVPSPWAIPAARARQLAAACRGRLRATLVTAPMRTEQLVEQIADLGVEAVQFGPLVSPRQVARLRAAIPGERLTILQVIPFADGRFRNENQVDEYLRAGVDFLLLDWLEKPSSPAAIPAAELTAFRRRHPAAPLLVAGGLTATNVRASLEAGDAAGIDLCDAVHRDGVIRREAVAELFTQLPDASERPSLRAFLGAAPPGNQVVAYLTVGDPPDRFMRAAQEALAAGALTLELGIPSPKPNEGPVLEASHRRALAAGCDAPQAIARLGWLARCHPVPLIAVVQWAALQAAQCEPLLDQLARSGAAAVLPVGLRFWQLPAFAAQVQAHGMEIVLPLAPTRSRTMRQLAYRYCTGGLYIPRGRTTGGGANELVDVDEFCRQVTAESELPMIVGIGVRTAADVAAICRTPAKAAAVGSALVDHLAQGGRADDFVRRLLAPPDAPSPPAL
jgi:tryptophan synthase alpha subunit/phosphoribosylanthranilate isomerase